MTTVAVGGVVAEVEGEGAPVVMIHGLGGTTNMFQPQMEALRGYRVVRLDLPGCGRSPVPAEPPSFKSYKTAVLATANALGVERAHLVGHSLGGAIAMEVARQAKARVKSLTLICSAGLGPDINMEYIDGFIASASLSEPHGSPSAIPMRYVAA